MPIESRSGFTTDRRVAKSCSASKRSEGDPHLSAVNLNYAIFAGRLVSAPTIETEAKGTVTASFVLENDLATLVCDARGHLTGILAQQAIGENLLVAGQLVTKNLKCAQKSQAPLLLCEAVRRIKLKR